MDKKNILVIDDEKDVATLVAARLNSHGFDACQVNSGEEALGWLKEKHPDLIVLDLFMPGMDGYDFFYKLRSDENTADIPVIMLTVETSPEAKLKSFKLGMDDYLVKPYEPEELVERINMVFRRKASGGGISGQGEDTILKDAKKLQFLKSFIEGEKEKD